MARTKQTAKRSTGGKAPRKDLTHRSARKTNVPPGKPRVRRRAKPGMAALREIRRLQKTTDLLIPKLSFQRVVREVVQDFKGEYRFYADALAALQEASEAYLTHLFADTQLIASTCKVVTIKKEHMEVVRHLVEGHVS